MERACRRCGKPFVPKRSTKVYCSDLCRSRASQDRAAQKPLAEVAPLPATAGPMLAAARVELEAAGRSDTTLGQMVLSLAARLDAGQDTGSAVAALTRELRVTMEQALDGAPSAADELDELKARRVAKYGR